jgi:flagellar basal-body rod modification protein FlgD
MQIQNQTQPAEVSHLKDPKASAASAVTNVDGLANENTFLQLLVAQIKNQDPTNPTDSVQFLGQLAQFSQLEQLIGIRQELQQPGSSAGTKDPITGKIN